MNTVKILENTIQTYAWGSRTAIADLLGEKSPSAEPQAELWMGAHPKAPSMVNVDGRRVALNEVIEQNPTAVLGQYPSERFKRRLPYLFKVLAAERPLSIQAHPNLSQAREGFERENRNGIPLNADHRNYRDDNHKPECICALTPFWALKGFRRQKEVLAILTALNLPELKGLMGCLREGPSPQGLKPFFRKLIKMEAYQRTAIITAVTRRIKSMEKPEPHLAWALKLHAPQRVI